MRHKRDETVTKRVTYRTECDACHKQEEGDAPASWIHFSSSHSEWGNDSIESWDEHDACSFACYLTIVRKLVEDMWSDHPSLVVDGKSVAFLKGMLASPPKEGT